MAHDHHHPTPKASNLNRAFIIGIGLNLAYVFAQVIVGLRINSLSLLSDAGHNFLDVGGLALALLAFRLTKMKATKKFTYGFKKSSILISLLNAVILLVSIGAIGYETVARFRNPQPIPGITIAWIALVGIVINGFSAFLFYRDKDKDINVKSAFLHLLSDALISVGLVVGGIIMHYTQMYWIDPLISLIICLIIIVSTWTLLRDSLRMSMDGVPEGINTEAVKEEALKIEGVEAIHHIHLWALSTTENAFTGHIVIKPGLTPDDSRSIKQKLRHELQHMNITHATIELEIMGDHCEQDC